MADIGSEELKNAVRAVLKTADLSVISTKGVRELVERKLDCSLISRKKEFDSIVMEYINSQQDDSESDDEEDGEEENDDNENEDEDDDDDEDDDNDSESSKKSDSSTDNGRKHNAKKRNQKTVAARKTQPKKKRKSLNASDSASESSGGSDSDYEVPKKKAAVAKKKKKSTGSSSGGGKDGGGGRKSTGFTRSYKLSAELSALMGSDSLPRHEVVKKVWAIIKERNLYDPKNKQFAICDDELMKVMKVKRFRTFGMLKHLKPHFLN